MIRWYEFLGLSIIMPIILVGSFYVMFLLTGADPLVDEIFRLRGINSVLREKISKLENTNKSDAKILHEFLKD